MLASALAERAALNDFGWIGERGPATTARPARRCSSSATRRCRRCARCSTTAARRQLDGSEEATLAEELGLRRADFAYRYLARITGREPEFDNDPAVKDQQIARLRDRL